MTGKYFESAEVSDVGRKRKNNEDACICIPDHGIFCIADGMGGQAGGDIASEAITTALQDAFTKVTPEDDATFGRRIALFRKATNQASKWIKNFADEKVIGQMGSTVVALVIDPRNPTRAVGLHAGDSRLYRYRKGKFEQITADHSAVAALAAKLGVPPESIPAKYQNELLRAVGLTEAVELERTPVDIVSGDVYLICSDGLTKMQTDEEIAKILKTGLNDPVDKIAHTLINAANEAGGKDNVSVVVVRAGDFTGAPSIIDLDDEQEAITSTAAPDLSLDPHSPTPTPGAPPSDAMDVHGETPQTPSSKGGAPVPTPTPTPTPPADGVASVAGPAANPVAQPPAMLVVPPAKKEIRPAAPTPLQPEPKKKSPVLLIIIVLAVLGALVWFICTRPKQKSDDVFDAPPAKALPGPDVLATVKTSTPAMTMPATNPPGTTPAPVPANTNPDAGRAALKNAQAAFDRRDFKNAAAYAAQALQNLPGDATAAKLQADSQVQIKNEEDWRSAFNNAQAAYNNHDFKNAATWASEALKAIPGEQTASKLRANALQQLQQASAVTDQNQKYQTAIQEAQNDFKRGSFSDSEKAAKTALALRPNDPAAQKVISAIDTQMDLESARRFFEQADYDTTLQICQSHAGVDGFNQLMAGCRDEQAALTTTKNQLAAGDYSFLPQLQSQAYARKGPFVELINQATTEQKLLAGLQSLQQAGNWQGLTSTLSSPAYSSVAGKTYFAALGQWARSQADQADNQKRLQQATVIYEEMLVWFNVKDASDPYIKTAEARKQKRLDGILEDPQRQKYLTTIAWLNSQFGKSGLLNQNDRAKYLKELQDTVAHHE